MIGTRSSPLPAHILAITLILTGSLGIFLQIIGWRTRKQLLLAAPPGSIASSMALTSRSGFGMRLAPYDDELTLEEKLDGLRFRLDKRTGDILAEDINSVSLQKPKPWNTSSDDARSLLSQSDRITSWRT